mmetsp:Transcript_12031/g.33168  ORF Transcript_12031/g.33168 Transcript_12031/m.33168 type:complete len:215 (-) Transcript_12031:214-858(-)
MTCTFASICACVVLGLALFSLVGCGKGGGNEKDGCAVGCYDTMKTIADVGSGTSCCTSYQKYKQDVQCGFTDLDASVTDGCAAVRDCSGVASLQQELSTLALDYECSSGGDVCQLFACQLPLVILGGVGNSTSCCKSYNAFYNCDCNGTADIATAKSLLCAAAQDCANYTDIEEHLSVLISTSGYNCGAMSEGKMLIVPSPSEKLAGKQEQEFV